MTALISPEGRAHYVHEGEKAYIEALLARGYYRLGGESPKPQPQPEPASEPEKPPADVPPSPAALTVGQIKDWLSDKPPLDHVVAVFAAEESGKHRKGALDALQDWLSDD